MTKTEFSLHYRLTDKTVTILIPDPAAQIVIIIHNQTPFSLHILLYA